MQLPGSASPSPQATGVEATPAFVATPSVAAHETRRQLEAAAVCLVGQFNPKVGLRVAKRTLSICP